MKRIVAALCATLILTAGCASEPDVNQVQRSDVEVDTQVGYNLTVTEVFREKIPQASGGSMLRMHFAVHGNADTRFAWKVTWFKANGMKVRGVGEGYRQARVLPDQTRYFDTTAPSPEAQSFQLHIREAN